MDWAAVKKASMWACCYNGCVWSHTSSLWASAAAICDWNSSNTGPVSVFVWSKVTCFCPESNSVTGARHPLRWQARSTNKNPRSQYRTSSLNSINIKLSKQRDSSLLAFTCVFFFFSLVPFWLIFLKMKIFLNIRPLLVKTLSGCRV